MRVLFLSALTTYRRDAFTFGTRPRPGRSLTHTISFISCPAKLPLFLSPSGQARPWPAGLELFDEEEDASLASFVLSCYLESSEELFLGSMEEDRRLGEELPLPVSM